MKRLLLSICIGGSLFAAAQTDNTPTPVKEGKVIYERTLQMQINFRGMNEDLARQLPRSRTDNFELSFCHNKCLWQQLPNASEEAQTFSGGGGNVMMIRGGGGADDVSFTDLETGKKVDQRELNSKNYLVDDSVKKLSWKLTDDTKTIMGYTARKAVAKQYTTRATVVMDNGEIKRQQVPDTVNVVAWFTTSIPVAAGPVFQGQLPGLILELDMNNGRSVYKAVEVSQKVNTGSIKEPKGGKRITAAEYAEEREKMMEEMKRNMPANGTFRIRS
jgi:GLPGLI family protein